MNSVTACPKSEEFEQLVEGRVSSERCEQLVDHLAACLRCAEAAEHILANSSIGQALGEDPLCPLPADDAIEPIIVRMRDLVLNRSSGGMPTSAVNTASCETLPDLEAGRDLAAFLAPPQADDEIGRLGGYRILNLLGAGGMGVVFLAEDPLLKRQVALKVLRPSLAVHPGSRKRLLREAQAMAAIQHDHIMHINQVGEERGVPFLAMPYLLGETLEDRLNRDRKLEVADALRIAREVAEGLAAAHQRGLIHRDIKPSNIWLEGAHGRVKILDFGLARAIQEDTHLTLAGSILGTPAYMSPEQASGGEVDSRSDLFSLGCVLYRMCTGHEPFRAGNPAAILLAVTSREPPPPVQLEPELPPALSQLIVRMLAKKPEGRPHSANAIVEELRTIEASLMQPRQTLATSAARPSSPNRRLGVALGVIFVALLVAGIVVIRLRNKDGSVVELRAAAEAVEVATDGQTPVEVKTPSPPISNKRTPNTDRAGQLPPGSTTSVTGTSPFDGLTRENLPALKDANGQLIELAPEIVAVLGKSNPPRFRRSSPVALSPDGRTVAFMPSNYQVTLWDVALAQPRHTLDVTPAWGQANSLVFEPDGRVISIATRKPGIQRWDTETGQLLESINLPDMEGFAQIGIAIGGTRLAMRFEQPEAPVVVWDLVERRELRRLSLDETRSIALSSDGRLLAAGGGQDGAGHAELWDLSTGEKIHEWGGDYAVNGLKFTRDGKRLFLIAGPTLVERDVTTGQVSRELAAGSNWIYRMAVTSDGRVAATFHVKDRALRVWDLEQGSVQRTVALPATDYESFGGWEFTSDGRDLLAARNDGLVFVLRLDLPAKGLSSSAGKPAASPFDQLNRLGIPPHELAAAGNGDPALAAAELVAVLGDSRLKHWAAVNDLAFTKDGGLLVSASEDSTVRLWDTGTANMVRQLDTEGPTHCLAISPDGQRIASGFQASVRIWELATGKVLKTLTSTRESRAQTWSLAISPNPDSPLLAATCHSSGMITVWNPDTGQELRTITAHKSTIVDLCFSPDGKWLASAGADDGTAKIWNAETGELLHSFDAQAYVGSAQFTSDSDQLVVGSRQHLTIRDRKSGELLRTISEGAERFVLTPDGDGIVFVRAYQAWLLKFDSPGEPRLIGWNHMNLNAAAISSDGRYVATAGSGMPVPSSDGAIRLWSVSDGRELHPSKGHGSSVNCVALRTGDSIPLIASGSTDHTVRLWNQATGDHVRTLSRPAHVYHVSFQPQGRHLLAGHELTNVLWDPETGEKRNEWTLKGWAISGAFLPDGRALLGGCMDGNVYQWNTSSGELLQTIDAQANDANSVICALAVDRSGRILALGNYERGPHHYEFKLWDRQAGKELHSLNHGCPIRAATFSPDGRRLATAGEWDHTAKIWDVQTGQLLHTLKGHQNPLASICFSPNGTRLATSARDGTIRVWEAWDSPAETTVHVVRLGPAGGHVNQVVFSDDGRHLVTANGNGTVSVLRAPGS